MAPTQAAGARVLLVIGKLGPGGAERQLSHLAIGLRELGWLPTLAVVTQATMDVAPLKAAGVELEVLGAGRGPHRAAALPRLVRLAREADLVHCTLWDGSLWGRLAAVVARRPVLVTDHSTDRRGQQSQTGRSAGRWIALHNRLLEPFTAATVACARPQIPMLVSEGVRPSRIVHIPNGVPVEEVARAARSGPTRSELGVPDGARIVAHVARFRPLKNQTLTFETVKRLRELGEDLHALFVGDGPGREELEQRAESESATWAHFLGRRTDVPALFALADLAVLPSLAEAMPMSLLEAMTVGTPFVATDVGDVRDLAERSGAGVVVPAGDGEAFLTACRELLADDALLARLSRAGPEAVEQWDSGRMAERYSELFAGILAGRPPGAVAPIAVTPSARLQ